MRCACSCSCPDNSSECDCDCNCPVRSAAVSCAAGFTRVCPLQGSACPPDAHLVCPAGAAAGRTAAGVAAPPRGCNCVPDFLMALVGGVPRPTAGRMIYNREDYEISGEYLEGELDSGRVFREVVRATVQVGARKCRCVFSMTTTGKSCKKSKGSCDAKCSGVAKRVVLSKGLYILAMKVTKGKVAITSCTVNSDSGSSGGGAGSGTPGGGQGGAGSGGGTGMLGECSCVSKPKQLTTTTTTGSGSTTTSPGPVATGSANVTGCKCGVKKKGSRIVGGTETEVNEYPWMTAIVSAQGERQFCGGSLVAAEWVLTAAHCMFQDTAG